MKKFIFLIFTIQIIGSNIYTQVVEQKFYDLEIPCKVTCKTNFVVYDNSDAWRAIDCKLSQFDFFKYTIIGIVSSTCGREGNIILKIIRDDENKKYIIKSRLQNPCYCMVLRQRPEIRIVYTKKMNYDYEVEYEYLKPSS